MTKHGANLMHACKQDLTVIRLLGGELCCSEVEFSWRGNNTFKTKLKYRKGSNASESEPRVFSSDTMLFTAYKLHMPSFSCIA